MLCKADSHRIWPTSNSSASSIRNALVYNVKFMLNLAFPRVGVGAAIVYLANAWFWKKFGCYGDICTLIIRMRSVCLKLGIACAKKLRSSLVISKICLSISKGDDTIIAHQRQLCSIDYYLLHNEAMNIECIKQNILAS